MTSAYLQNGPLDGSIVLISQIPKFTRENDIWTTDPDGVFGYVAMPDTNMVHPGTKDKYPLYTFAPLNPISLICEDLREAAKHIRAARAHMLRATTDRLAWNDDGNYLDVRTVANVSKHDADCLVNFADSLEVYTQLPADDKEWLEGKGENCGPIGRAGDAAQG